MKKVFFFICVLFSLTSYCQTLDTVRVRNLQMRTSDWAYLSSYMTNRNDSVGLRVLRKIRSEAQTLVSPTWNTQMTVDTLPGEVVLMFYRIAKSIPAGEAESVGSNIATVIKAVNNSALQYFIGRVDETGSSEYLRKRNIGKSLLLDQ